MCRENMIGKILVKLYVWYLKLTTKFFCPEQYVQILEWEQYINQLKINIMAKREIGITEYMHHAITYEGRKGAIRRIAQTKKYLLEISDKLDGADHGVITDATDLIDHILIEMWKL